MGALFAVWLVCTALAVGALAACGATTPPNAFHECGTVHVAAGRILPSDAAAASAAETCFAHDYTNCQASVLTVTEMGVDTGTTHNFSERLVSGKCAVTDRAQGYTANGGGTTFPAQTYGCAGVQQQADGLRISDCGQEGNILVPAPPSTP